MELNASLLSRSQMPRNSAVPVVQLVTEEGVRRIRVLEPRDVGEANVVVLPLGDDSDGDGFDFVGGFGGLLEFHESSVSGFCPRQVSPL